MSQRKDEVTKQVNRLLKRHKIQTAPVPVEDIALREGLKVLYEPFEDTSWSGMLYCVGKESIIAINDNHTETRKRFTLAHELGHYFLTASSKSDNVYLDTAVIRFRDQNSAQGRDQEEVDANQFAAELLMPEKLLEADLLNAPDDLEAAIHELAERYRVSHQAMTIRLVKLNRISFDH